MEVTKIVQSILISAVAGVLCWVLVHQAPVRKEPFPVPIILPSDGVRPHYPHMPWLPRLRQQRESAPIGKIVAGGSTAPDGKTEVTVDILAVPDRKHNISSKGLGCCVFRSLDYAARWQNVPQLYDFPEWMVTNKIEGGGYPGKVSKLIPQISKARGLPPPNIVQYENGANPDIIKLALKTGRIACVTYSGQDRVHYSGRIAHMLCCVAWSDEADLVGICDNNFPNEIVWMTRADFLQRWKADGAWACVLLSPGPPPPPKN